MLFTKEVEIIEEMDVEISILEIFDNMSDDEVIEMHRLCDNELKNIKTTYKDYYLSNLFLNKTDSEILNSEEILSKLVYFLKYEDSTLLEFVKDELNGK